MTLDQFVVMDAVVRLGSFSAASRELNRVQSAVSYAIKTLEEEVGVSLFSRETYRPGLTPAGEAIYRKVREVLMDVEEIDLLRLHLNQGREPLVRFDISPVCPLSQVTDVLKNLEKVWPQTRLEISMEIFGGEALVLADKVDISLTDLIEVNDALETVPWLDLPLIPVVSANHPLAETTELSRALMLKQVQIIVRSISPHTEKKSLGIMEGNTTWSVGDFPAKRCLLLAGLGWGNMPEYMVAEDLLAGRLKLIDPPGHVPQVARLHLVRKRLKAHGPVATHLWDSLKKCREPAVADVDLA